MRNCSIALRLCILLLPAYGIGCGTGSPPEFEATTRSAVESPSERVVGHFSTGCTGALPLRDHLRLLTGARNRALVSGALVTSGDTRGSLSIALGERTRSYNTTRWRLTVARTLVDTTGLSPRATGDLEVDVILPRSARERDAAGRLWLPLPSTEAERPVVSGSEPEVGPLFVLERRGDRWLIVAQFALRDGDVVRGAERVSLEELLDEVRLARSGT